MSKLCASLEFYYLLGSNSELLACSGVDTFASGTLGNRVCAKANELYVFTCYESFLNSLYSSVESLLCICLAQTGNFCDLCNQFSLVHNVDIKWLKIIRNNRFYVTNIE